MDSKVMMAETDRLILRRYIESDLQDLFSIKTIGKRDTRRKVVKS